MALPRGSQMVMVVLLKVALTCPTPSASTTRLVFFPIAIRLLGYLLLAGNRAAWPLLRARIGMCPLATHWQTAAMTRATIRPDVHQSLDVHRDFRAQRTLHAIILLDLLPHIVPVTVRQLDQPL